MIKKLELSGEDFKDLFAYAHEKAILFLSSPFDKGSVDLLSELGVSAFKIPSGEITNFPLLKHIPRKRKPIILSTGMATQGEVEEALEVIKEEGIDDMLDTLQQRALETNCRIWLVDHRVMDQGCFSGTLKITKDKEGSSLEYTSLGEGE